MPTMAPLTSLPRELMIQIASSLDPRTILALTHSSPLFAYLLCVFSGQYTITQDVSGRNYTPLQYFISREIERVVIHLLDSGADPNAAGIGPTTYQEVPLMVAIQHMRASMVSLLIRYGARVDDPDGIDEDYPGCTPLHSVLIRHSDFQRRFRNPSAGSSASTQVLRIVQSLLDARVDFEVRTEGGYTALHIACGTWDVDPAIIAILMAAGADVRRTTLSSYLSKDKLVQPIHLAAAAGNTSVVQMLLSAGAGVEVETGDGVRAVDLAIMGMHAETLQLLVDVGADMSIRESDESGGAKPRDPFFLVGNDICWGQLDDWFLARGWRNRGLSLEIWACQSTNPHTPRDRKCGFRRSW